MMNIYVARESKRSSLESQWVSTGSDRETQILFLQNERFVEKPKDKRLHNTVNGIVRAPNVTYCRAIGHIRQPMSRGLVLIDAEQESNHTTSDLEGVIGLMGYVVETRLAA